MTTAMRSDIEQALTEALGLCGWASPPDEAAAILATPSMQAIARQAAIGAAVERISRWGMDGFTIEHDAQADVWDVTITGYDHATSGWCPTLPAAIAAALGEDDE